MSVFNDGTIICVCCKERMHPNKIVKFSKNIGICAECFEKIETVPLFNPFEGTQSVKYVISGYYYNDILKTLIHRYKFGGEYLFSELFSTMLYERICDIQELYNFDYITSVPISRQRFSSRGFNQSELIAKNVAERLNIPYEICIHKHKHTIAQSLLKKSKRIKNIRGAFIADAQRVKNKRILLVDDIFTTGSTMNECANELLSKDANFVAGISFAIAKRRVISEALKIWGSGF